MGHVRPLLKKLGMALLDMNYRPVSNLPFISKIIEKYVAEQLVHHIDSNGLNEIMQSAYKNITVLRLYYLKLRVIFCKTLRMAMLPALSHLTYQLPLTWSITKSYCKGYNTGMELRE